jgi:hypothetical protein
VLNLAQADTTPDPSWLDGKLEEVGRASESQGQTELVILESVRHLVCTVAGPAGEAAAGCQPEEESEPASEH